MKKDYDIIIVGGGLVGASLAIALSNTPLKIAVLEHQTLPSNKPFNAENSRPLSLNYGSHQILKSLNIWQHLAAHASPISQVHVSERGHFGSVRFHAQDYHLPSLGYVVPAALLQNQLQTHALNLNSKPYIFIDELLQISKCNNSVEITCRLKTNEIAVLSTPLFIVADGANSTARQLLGIAVTQTDLKQTAFTGVLQVTRPHQQKAHERFSRQGIIALLPLHDAHSYGLVWTAPNQLAHHMLQWTQSQWQIELLKIIGFRLGNIHKIEMNGHHPLQMMVAQEYFQKNIVLIGNAAHTLSPIAAQGFNLSLREVAVLSETLMSAVAHKKHLGELDILHEYNHAVDTYRKTTMNLTQNIGNIFDLHGFGFSATRAKGLLAMEYLPYLKTKMALQFLGLAGDLPKLARGIPLQ